MLKELKATIGLEILMERYKRSNIFPGLLHWYLYVCSGKGNPVSLCLLHSLCLPQQLSLTKRHNASDLYVSRDLTQSLFTVNNFLICLDGCMINSNLVGPTINLRIQIWRNHMKTREDVSRFLHEYNQCCCRVLKIVSWAWTWFCSKKSILAATNSTFL